MMISRLIVTTILVLIGVKYLENVKPMYANIIICFLIGLFASFAVPKRVYYMCVRFVSKQWAKIKIE